MLHRPLLSLVLLALLAGCVTAAPGGEAIEVGPAPDGSSLAEVVATPGPTATPAPVDRPADPPADAAPRPVPTTDPSSPRGVVEEFYRWYLAQPNGDVITHRTFFESPLLSDIMKSDTNYLLDEMINTSGYDPFTCAQNILPSLAVTRVFVSGSEAHAIAEVIIDGQVRHYFVANLSTSEGPWKIDAIRCPRMPETPAYALFTWYLNGVYGDRDADAPLDPQAGSATWGSPLAAGAHHDYYLVSDVFRTEIAAALEPGGAGDPFRVDGRPPLRFWIEPLQQGMAITVRADYDARTSRTFTVHLVDAPPGWRVNRLEVAPVPVFDPSAGAEVDTTGWQEYHDAEYGFSLRYPVGWWTAPASTAGLPADDPLRKGANFFDPRRSASLPAVWLTVLEGSEAQVIAYYPTEDHQVVPINGHEVWVDRAGCATRFVFRHPTRAGVWLVIGSGSAAGSAGCPSGEAGGDYAKSLEEMLVPLLRTVQFE